MKLSRLLLLLASTMALATQANARASRPQEVPNGLSVSCSLCHIGANFASRTLFGDQVEANLVGDPIDVATITWSDIYALDADGDGATNGAELGDPNGTWVQGDPDPGVVSDPSDPADFPAGGGAGGAGGGNPNSDAGAGSGGDDSGDSGCAANGGAPTAPLALALAVLGGVILRRRSGHTIG